MTPNEPLLGYFAVLLTLMVAAQAALRLPFLTGLGVPNASRFASLDGLRGVLATGVFVSHAVVFHHFLQTGIWKIPEERLYDYLGGDSVNVFFMITGFLFWRRCLAGNGSINAANLMMSRLKRIMPAYLFSATLVIGTALTLSNFELRVPADQLAVGILRWLAGGLFGSPDINGVATVFINCGVTWTLQYEWAFYLALPLIAVFATHRRIILLCGLYGAALAASHFHLVDFPFSIGSIGRFLMGILVAHAYALKPDLPQLRSAGVGACIMAVLGICVLFPVPRAVVGLTLWMLFIAVIYGNTLLGLLTTRWMTMVGHLSYSIYLLHGIVLSTVLRQAGELAATATTAGYWSIICLTGVLVLAVSTASYLVFEAPFLGGWRGQKTA